jgi:hypothetical protein
MLHELADALQVRIWRDRDGEQIIQGRRGNIYHVPDSKILSQADHRPQVAGRNAE